MEALSQVKAGQGSRMTRRPSRGILAILCLLLCALQACVQAILLVPVTKSGAIVGALEMRRGGTVAWAKARPETILYVGDTIRARRSAQVLFLDGTTLTLQGGTQVYIVAFDPDKKALRFKMDLATIETNDSLAHIQVSESGVDVSVDSGYVSVLAEGGQQQVQSGETISLAAAQPLAEQGQATPASVLTQEALLVTSTPSPMPLAEAGRTLSPTWGAMPTKVFRVFLTHIETGRTLSAALRTTPTKRVAATSTPIPPKTPTPKPGGFPSPTPSPAALVIRVNCGGPAYRDRAGHLWAADREHKAGSWGYRGGNVYTTGNGIANTEDDLLYQSERWGNFYYLFDIPNGNYKVTLRFAEIYRDNVEGRVFSVRLEGHPVITDLDLVAKVGRDVAYDQTFTVELTDGQLGIEFIKKAGDPKISAIAIEVIR